MADQNYISKINGALISASYAATASRAATASLADSATAAAYADTAGALSPGTYQITSSWANNAVTASNAHTSSFLSPGTYQVTSSWAINALTASVVTNAARVSITNVTSNPGVTYYIPFVDGTGNNQSLQIDSASNAGLTYTPTTDSITVARITGSLAGTATTASSVTPLTQNVSVTGSVSISGSTLLSGSTTVTGQLTAQGISRFNGAVQIDPGNTGTALFNANTGRVITLGNINGGASPDVINVIGTFQISPGLQRVAIVPTNGGFFEIAENGNTKLGDDVLKNIAITGSVNVVGALSMQNSVVTLAPTSTTRASIIFTPSSSLMTTPIAGAMEYNGIAFYATPTASARAVVATEHFCCSTAPWTLTNTAALQKIFGTDISANGALSVAAGDTYFFECSLNISGMSTGVSGNIGFSILGAGTATFTSAAWQAFGLDATTQSTAAAIGGSFSSTGAATGNIVTATTGGALSVLIKGIFRVNTAGTIIPSLQLTTAVSTAVVGVNSWFKCYPVGSNTVTAIGPWS